MLMVGYVSVPVIRLPDGVVVEATPNGAWVIWPGNDKQLFITESQFEAGWHYPSGARITPVSKGVLIEMPGASDVAFTKSEINRILEKIREMRSDRQSLDLGGAH
jgi:hypothetical protein